MSAAPASAEKRTRKRRVARERPAGRIEAKSATTPGRGFDCQTSARTPVPVTPAELCLFEQWLGTELDVILDAPADVPSEPSNGEVVPPQGDGPDVPPRNS